MTRLKRGAVGAANFLQCNKLAAPQNKDPCFAAAQNKDPLLCGAK
jgi:hypothetical protein